MSSFNELFLELLSPSVLLACLAVMVNPLLWNMAARLEYRTHLISRVCRGPRPGVVVLATGILATSYLRTLLFYYVVNWLGMWEPARGDVTTAIGYVCMAAGGLLVLTSSWRLGFFCTFLGDYFGILLDKKVTEFPFNFVEDPMYWGSVMIYVGTSVQHASLVGFLLTGCIALSYVIAVQYEGPFTSMIYARRKKFTK